MLIYLVFLKRGWRVLIQIPLPVLVSLMIPSFSSVDFSYFLGDNRAPLLDIASRDIESRLILVKQVVL